MDTFVVHVWAPAESLAEGQDATDLRGVLEHVASGRRRTFRGPDELVALILSRLDAVAAGQPAADEVG